MPVPDTQKVMMMMMNILSVIAQCDMILGKTTKSIKLKFLKTPIYVSCLSDEPHSISLPSTTWLPLVKGSFNYWT